MAIEKRSVELLDEPSFRAFSGALEMLCRDHRVFLCADNGGGLTALLSAEPGFERLENGDERLASIDDEEGPESE